MKWGPVTESHAFHQVSVRRRTYWRLLLRCSARDRSCVGVCARGSARRHTYERERESVYTVYSTWRRVRVNTLEDRFTIYTCRSFFQGISRLRSRNIDRSRSPSWQLAIERKQWPPPFSPPSRVRPNEAHHRYR